MHQGARVSVKATWLDVCTQVTCHPAAFVTTGQCVGEKQFMHRRSSELYVQSTQLTLQKKDCSGPHIYPKGLTVGLIRTPSTQSEPMTLSLLAGNGLCGGEWVRNSKDLLFRVQFTQAVSQRMPHFGEASKSLRCPLCSHHSQVHRCQQPSCRSLVRSEGTNTRSKPIHKRHSQTWFPEEDMG